MPLGVDLWTKFGRCLLPTWSQVGTKMGSKIDVNFEWRFFKKHCFSKRKIRFFGIKWVQVESQNRPKIDQKTESKMDGILASIFLGFWSILGGKLGGKPEPRSTQKGIEKIVEKRKSTRRPKNRPQDGQQGLWPPLTRDIFDPNRRWGGVGGGLNNPTTQMLVILTRHWAKGPANFLGGQIT